MISPEKYMQTMGQRKIVDLGLRIADCGCEMWDVGKHRA